MRSYIGKVAGDSNFAAMMRIAAQIHQSIEKEFAAKGRVVEVTPAISVKSGFLAFSINEHTNTASQPEMQKLVRGVCKAHMSGIAELVENPISNQGEIRNFFAKSAEARPDDLSGEIEIASIYFGRWAPSSFSKVNHYNGARSVESSALTAEA